jgi:mannosyltransferase
MTKNYKLLILLILFLGFLMRLTSINQSFWLDEAIGAVAVKEFGYADIVTVFMRADNHPPLYYLFLKFWTEMFGFSELSLRLPSVILGVATIYLTILIAFKVSQKRSVAISAGLFLLTSQFHIYYSQEARMYSMAAFFAALLIYSFLFILERDKVDKYSVLFSASLFGLMFTDYLPVLLLPILFVVPISMKKNTRWWCRYLVLFLPLIIFGAVWLPYFIYQSTRGRWLVQTLPAWKTLAGGATFKQAVLVWMKFVGGRLSFVNKVNYYLYILIVSTPFLYLFSRVVFRLKIKFLIVWLWLLVPLTTGFLLSFFFPAFIYFRFLYVVPAFYLLLSLGLDTLKSSMRKIVAFTVILINITSWTIYVYDTKQQREMWRQAVGFVEEKVQKDEVILMVYPEPFAPYRWYSKKSDAKGATDSISANEEATKQKTKNALSKNRGVYYFEYLDDLTDPNGYVMSEIKENGFEVSQEYSQFWGVGKITYWIRP